MFNVLRGSLFVLLLIVSCKSTESHIELAAALPLESNPSSSLDKGTHSSCAAIPECAPDESRSPYQCVAYRYAGELLWEDQRSYAWGPNLCEAKRALAVLVCSQNKDLAQIEDVSCAPDASMGACPLASPQCGENESPKRCSARAYQDQELSWEQRPTAWGRNECETRHKVLVKGCELGFNPRALSQITCDADLQPGQCPPPPPSCKLEQREPTECSISALGSKLLQKPWKAIGTSICEAQYRLQEMACRFEDGAKQLTAESMSGMECRSLAGPTPASSR